MEPGEVREVTAGDCADYYYVDTGMYGTSEYGAAYVIDADRPAIVETGIGTHHERILDALDAVGIGRDAVEAIAVTHVHLDHAGGAGFLASACPNADVYVSPVGAPHLVDPGRLVEGTKRAVGDQWRHYVEPEPVPEARIVEIDDGDAIDLGERELRVHAAPGHAPHQVVFEDPAANAVFTGDAAGIWIPTEGRIAPTSPPPQFDLEACLEDVETLRAIDPDVCCYTHFGPRYVGDDVGAALDAYATALTEWVDRVESVRGDLDTDEAVIDSLADAADTDAAWGEEKAVAEAAMNVRGALAYLDRRES